MLVLLGDTYQPNTILEQTNTTKIAILQSSPWENDISYNWRLNYIIAFPDFIAHLLLGSHLNETDHHTLIMIHLKKSCTNLKLVGGFNPFRKILVNILILSK